MMYLLENDSQDKLSDVEKGDQIRIVTNKQELEYSTVVSVTGNQIEIINNGKPFIVLINSAIDGDTFSYTNKDKKWFNMKFQRIDIKNEKVGKMFHIWPVNQAGEEMKGEDSEEAVDPEFQEYIKESLIQFKSTVQKLQIGDKLYVGYGEWEFDDEGNFEERIKQKTDTQILFTVLERKGIIVRMKLTGVQGVDAEMHKLRGREFSIELSNSLFQYDKEGVFLNLMTPNGRAPLKYLFMFDRIEPSQQEDDVAQETKESRLKFHKTIAELEKGDTFKIKFGDMLMGPNGLPTFDIDEDTETIANFEKLGDLKGYIYTKLTSISGALSGNYKKYEGEYIYFALNDKLFTFNDTGVILNALHLNNAINFKYVFYVDSDTFKDDESDEESVEQDKESRISKLAKDKDLMRLLHTKSWRDRLMGREGVGINPVKDIEKRLGLDRRTKGYVQLQVMDKDIVIGRGTNLRITKGKSITGRMVNSDRIIIKSKNGKEELQLFLSKTTKQDIYNVKVVHVDSNGEKNNYGKATIEIFN